MDVSVVIPYFNRADTIGHTLESVGRATADLRIEIVLVDDGSTPPAADSLARKLAPPHRIVRQENRGLLFARLAGLREARGEFVLFLDSDDLIGPEKLTRHVAAMRAAQADVSYSDTLHAMLGTPWSELRPPANWQPGEESTDVATFFIRVQPPPHSPVFRTEWLRRVVTSPLFPPSPCFNPVAEIWFYHVAAVTPARVIKVPGIHNAIGQHAGERITACWEKMAVAALGVQEAFMRACPRTAATEHVRRLVGEKAFNAWRALPHDFFPVYRRRLLALWREAPRGPLARLGGPVFQRLARLIGPVAAGAVMRRLRGHAYASCRSADGPDVFHRQLALLDAATR